MRDCVKNKFKKNNEDIGYETCVCVCEREREREREREICVKPVFIMIIVTLFCVPEKIHYSFIAKRPAKIPTKYLLLINFQCSFPKFIYLFLFMHNIFIIYEQERI